MRPRSSRGDDGPQAALTAGLDIATGWLTQDGDIGAQPVGKLALDPTQPVRRCLDLFAVIEDQRDVVRRFRDGGGQMQEHRVTRLHICGAAAVDMVGITTSRDVIGDGHGVEVTGQYHPAGSTEVGAGEYRIAMANHLVAGLLSQRAFDFVSDAPLVAGHAGNINQSGGQIGRIGAEVKHN